MNINDYQMPPQEESAPTTMQYDSFDSAYENRYPSGSQVSMKGRPDVLGRIDRIEDKDLIVKIFDETYKIPPEKFETLFYMHSENSPTNWYSRTKNQS